MYSHFTSIKILKQIHQHSRFLNIQNRLTTWSSLGATFNSLPNRGLVGAFSISKNLGLFCIKELSGANGFYSLKERASMKADQLVNEILSLRRTRKMVVVFDDLSDTLCQVADLAEFVRVAHPSSPFRDAAEYATNHINGIVEKLNTNKSIYDALKDVVEHGDKYPTTEVDKHVSELFLFDFEQSGIHLEKEKRDRVVDLNESILAISQSFMMNSSKTRIFPSNDIPDSIRQYFTVSQDEAYINGLYADSPNEMAREFAYKLYLQHDDHQEFLLNELLEARYDLAVTCGFPSYVHRALNGTLANSPEFVSKFLNKLNDELKIKCENDVKVLLKAKQKIDPSSKEIHHWDVGYFTSKLKKDYLQLHSNELSSYFCLGACMEGLNNLIQKLFGITFVLDESEPKEFWVDEVYKLQVMHEKEGVLGWIYCDFYQRPGKPNQDCHFTIRGGRELPNGTYQNPIVVLMLNFQKPHWNGPCLLTPGQLDNLAHEMGHALHSMLARTKYQHVSGTRCCTDIAEVPSILMEYFLSDPRVLKTFAKHFQTKEPLSDEVIEKLCSSKHLLSATETHTQVLYSALDQKLHERYPLGKRTTDIFYNTQSEYSILKPVPNAAWQLRFSHLVGYGAKYYSYLLSKSIASCIWQKYFKEDPFSREQGEKYRFECLSHGGGKPPRKLFNDFLGITASPEIMAEYLLSEIEENQHIHR